MKNIFLLIGFLFLSLFISCNKNENENQPNGMLNADIAALNKVLLLKIDYLTYQFEGAKQLVVSPEKSKIDSLPIISDYKALGDFGSVTLYYQAKPDTVFFGTIHWMGEGEIYFPKKFDSMDYYSFLDAEIPIPTLSRFQLINYDSFYSSLIPINYSSIWKAVSKLSIVDEYLLSNKKIGLLLYTPGVGVGNPAKWYWILILDN